MSINSKSKGIFEPDDTLNFGMNKGYSLKELYLYRPSYLEWLILNIEGFAINIQEFYALGKPTPLDKYFTEYSQEESRKVISKLEVEVKNMDSADKIYELISVVAAFVIDSEENKKRIQILADKCRNFIKEPSNFTDHFFINNLYHPNVGLFPISTVYLYLEIGKKVGISLYEVDYKFPREVVEKNESKISFFTS